VTGPGAISGWEVWDALERTSRDHPAREAVCEYDARGHATAWSYPRLHHEACAVAHTLSRRAAPGDRVVLDGTGGARQISTMLGAIRAGLWVLPVPLQTTPHELGNLFHRANARLVIGPQQRLPERGWLDWKATEGQHTPEPTITPGGVMMVTSGTTGARKLALRDCAALDADARHVRDATGLTPEDRVLLAISLSHSYALDLIVGAVLAGACVETVPVFDLPTIASRIARGATVFPGVPFLFEGLGARWEGAGDLRLAFSAGTRLPCSTRRAFTDVTGVPIGDLYGATELGTVVFRDPLDGDPAPGLVGRPLPGVSARVLDPSTGRTLAPGEEGELAIRAPSMLCGYEHAEPDLADGHFRTGDLARLDDRGRVHITGRLRFMIEAGGLKLNPIELEEVIERHPGVRECLVLPMPASETVSRIRALVVPDPVAGEPSESELRAYLRERVGPAKIPRRFEFVDALPRSSTGKLMRLPLEEVSR